jgi:hypothetical protein
MEPSQEAVEAAAKAAWLEFNEGDDMHGLLTWDSEGLPQFFRDRTINQARAALTAALPIIRREITEEIEAQPRLPYAMQRYVRMADIAIVRGEVSQ